MRKAIVFFLIIIMVWVGSGVLRQKGRSDGKASKSSRSPAKAMDQGEHRAQGGERVQIYEFKRGLKTLFHAKGKSRTLLKLNYEGEVRTFNVQDSKGKSWVQIRFDFQFHSESGRPEARLTSKLPFLMELGPDHSLKSLRSPHASRDSERDELNLFRDLASLFAFRSTSDTTGPFDQEWIPGANGGGKKIKRNYRGDLKNKIKITRSLHEVTLDDRGIVVQLKGRESTLIPFQASMQLTTESSYEFQLKAKTNREEDWVQEKSPESLSEIDLPMTGLKIEEARRPEKTSEWNNAVLRLKRFSHLEGQGRLELFHDLLLSLRQDFAHVDEMIQWAEAHPGNGSRVAFAIGVLAQLDSDEAQKTLVKWYRELGDDHPEYPYLILNALATTQVPLKSETIQFLMGLPDSEGSAALVLGASLRLTPNDAVRSRLKLEFESAVSESKRAILLDAIGNSGDAFFVSTLRDALRTGSVGIRERAALAARFIPGEAGLSILTEAYYDRDERVRRAAIQALEYSKDLASHLSLLEACARDGRVFCVRALQR